MDSETDNSDIKYDRNDPDDWYKLKQLALYGYGPLDCGTDYEVVKHIGSSGYEFSEQVGKD